jgi:hypothetical protein
MGTLGYNNGYSRINNGYSRINNGCLHCIYTAISNDDDLKLKSIQLPKRAKI